MRKIVELFIEDNKSYILRNNLAKILNISPQMVISYEKRANNPLKRATIEAGGICYDLLYALSWHRTEVNTQHRPQKDGFSGVDDSDSGIDTEYDGGEITMHNARVAKDVEEAKLKKTQAAIGDLNLKEAKGEYIKADDLDKIIVEMAVTLLSSMRNWLEILPSMLENKDKDTIKVILDDQFEKDIEVLNKKANLSGNSITLHDFMLKLTFDMDKIKKIIKAWL